MSSNIDSLLSEFKGKLTPEHLFAVTNLEVDESLRKPVLMPGHLAEGFILGKCHKVEYVGENSGSSPAKRREDEKKAIKALKDAVKDEKLKDLKGE